MGKIKQIIDRRINENMSKFIIDREIFNKLPEACFGVVVAKGIDNKANNEKIKNLLENEINDIRVRLEGVNLKQYDKIAFYREAFQVLGINPNRYANSVEALIKRVMNGSPFPQINSIVDIGNAMSLKYILPMGAHDIDKLNGGDLEVRFANSKDRFVSFGEENAEEVPIRELIYVTGNTVKTRRWIWRQSENGKINENSTNVVFPIDGFLGKNDVSVKAATEELAKNLQEVLNCEVVIGFLTRDNNQIEL